MNDFDKIFVLAFYNSFLKIKLNCHKENMLILNVYQCRFENHPISPYQNKKASSPIHKNHHKNSYHKNHLGCLTFIFHQKHFFMIKWTQGIFILMWRYVRVRMKYNLGSLGYLLTYSIVYVCCKQTFANFTGK